MSLVGYKCRVCGEIIKSDTFMANKDKKQQIIKEVFVNEQFKGNPYLASEFELYKIHNCNNESLGIADFMGILEE